LALEISPLTANAWDTDWGQKLQIADILKGMAFLKTLRSVTICIRLVVWGNFNPYAFEWKDLRNFGVWRELDLVLYSAISLGRRYETLHNAVDLDNAISSLTHSLRLWPMTH
jgi:hypothetical protein